MKKSLSNSFSHEFMWEEVRASIRKNSLTHSEIAKRMGVSIPSLRRWLGGGTITFIQWTELMAVVGLSLSEIEKKLRHRNRDEFTYNENQERELAKNSSALSIFDMILNGAKISDLLKKSDVSLSSFTRYLKILEKLNLIERLPHDKIKIIPKGEPVWSTGGPLQEAFSKGALNRFLKNDSGDLNSKMAYKKFKTIYIKKSDTAELNVAFDDLFQKISKFEIDGRFVSFAEKERIAIFFKAKEFSFEFLENIDEC